MLLCTRSMHKNVQNIISKSPKSKGTHINDEMDIYCGMFIQLKPIQQKKKKMKLLVTHNMDGY